MRSNVRRILWVPRKTISLLPDPDFLYLSKKHDAALTLLDYSLAHGNTLSVISGQVGTGKTTLIRHLINHLGKDITIGLISNTHPAFEDLLQWILLAFDLSSRDKSRVESHHIFSDFLKREHARNRRVVLIIDEAQNMSPECLGELVLWSNMSTDYNQVLQIVLVGQSGLREILQRPELENIRQRIGVDYHLEPLNREETHYYILHRLKVAGGKDPGLFSAEARDTIFRYSGGIPRLINLLCETALVYGFSEQKCMVDTALIEVVAHDKKAGGIVPLQDNLWDSPTEPQRTPALATADSATQPYDVFLEHRDKVAFPPQESCSKGEPQDRNHQLSSLRPSAGGAQESKPAAGSTDPVAEEAFHAIPVQTPMSTPSNRTAAAAPKPTFPRSGKTKQVALYLGLVLAVGLLGGYRLLETVSTSEPLTADQSQAIGQIDHSDKEDQRSATVSHVPNEGHPAVETSDLDSATEGPIAVTEPETKATTASTVPTVVIPETLPSAPPMPAERGTAREAPIRGVATETAPAETSIHCG